jgi:signal transduction histidine kinase
MEDKGLSVLLIEDNPGDALLIRKVLDEVENEIFRLESANRLSTGLGQLHSGDVDVILLDLSLPDSQGLDTFTRVHSQAPEVPIVVLSGLDDETLAVEAVRQGAQDYLVKGHADSNVLARSMRYAIERKRVEERLQELYENERTLREEREAEINKRVEFTRALVHELKTPLTSVMASSELLMSELTQGPLLKLAENLYRGACNLNRRIDELLDLARGELGMIRLRCKPVDLPQLLTGVAEDMVSAISSHSQSLLLDMPANLPLVWVDEDRIQQVVVNLLNNASKFTPEEGRITLRAMQRDSCLTVEVEDTGSGIDEDEQQRLFDPYHRLEGDRERLSGLGLGLSLCKMLVQLHGGEIWIRSRKGHGSTFAFSVPLERTAPGAENAERGDNHESPDD